MEDCSVYVGILIDTPFRYEIVGDGRSPDHIIVRLIFRPISISQHDHKFVFRFDASEDILMPGKHVEKLIPAFDHRFFCAGDIARAIDERMIVSHQTGKPVEIVPGDAIIECQRDGFRVFCVHLRRSIFLVSLCPPASNR